MNSPGGLACHDLAAPVADRVFPQRRILLPCLGAGEQVVGDVLARRAHRLQLRHERLPIGRPAEGGQHVGPVRVGSGIPPRASSSYAASAFRFSAAKALMATPPPGRAVAGEGRQEPGEPQVGAGRDVQR
ncbi:hypothetical protein [Streptomyces dysideae]|uniref:hypothetical protein n=1 Tax=Streptomyces dysideae TaxID=909626 RepID=UPI0018FE213C|nr:hypothetical protein [Streptomyces dysideae]